MPKKLELSLGVLATDILTGLSGTVNMRAIKMDGNIQFCIKPKIKKDGTDAEGFFVDEHLVKVTGVGISALVVPTDPTVTVELGKKYLDVVSNIKGIAVERIDHLNGCVYFTVQPKAGDGDTEKETGMPKSIYVQHGRLKLIDDGVTNTNAVRIPTAAVVAPKETPGAASRSMRDVIG